MLGEDPLVRHGVARVSQFSNGQRLHLPDDHQPDQRRSPAGATAAHRRPGSAPRRSRPAGAHHEEDQDWDEQRLDVLAQRQDDVLVRTELLLRYHVQMVARTTCVPASALGNPRPASHRARSSDVDDVAGAERDLAVGRADDQPPVVVDGPRECPRPSAHPGSSTPHHRVRSWRTARGTPRAAQSGRRRVPPLRVRRRPARRAGRRGRRRVEPAAPLRARSRCAPGGSSSGRFDDVEPDPDHDRVGCAAADHLDQDAGDLAPVDQHVVRPLEPGLDADPADRAGDRQPGQQRQPRPALPRDRDRPEQHRHRDAGARRRRPRAGQPTPSGGLVVGRSRPSPRRPPREPARRRRRSSSRSTLDARRRRRTATDAGAGRSTPRGPSTSPAVHPRASHVGLVHGVASASQRAGTRRLLADAREVATVTTPDAGGRRRRSTSTPRPASSPTCTAATTRRCTPGRPARSRSSTRGAR